MSAEGDLWRAMASPWRRQLLDQLRGGPRTTGDLVDAIPELSRYAVMQHLGVLVRAGVVLVRRRGRHRFNHLNPVPLRRWYERWVQPMADGAAGELLALERAVDDEGARTMATVMDEVRTVRIETELRFRAPAARVFEVLSGDTQRWFPHSYGEDRTQRVVIEPRVGGAHFEDWGDGAGYLYGHVTEWDPPHRLGLRGRVMAGSILDTRYEISEEDGESTLRMSKVAVGPMTAEEADGIRQFGDIARSEERLRAVIEG
jgi:DNA-binding transcriptional ArsR family regulator